MLQLACVFSFLQMAFPLNKFAQPVLGYSKNEHHFPYLKATAKDLLGMTATSALSERVFSHAGELYSAKRADLGAEIFATPLLIRMNPHLALN